MNDPRTPEWYMKIYRFLEKFPDYHLRHEYFLEGMYQRFCLLDKKTKEWLGPEVELYTPKNQYRVDNRRMLLR